MGSRLANPLRAADLSPLRERSSLKRTQRQGPVSQACVYYQTSLSFNITSTPHRRNLKVSLIK